MKNVIREKVKLIFQKHYHTPIEAAAVVLEFGGKHIEIRFADRTLSYKRVISPNQGGESFPAGYFDNHSADIDDYFLTQIQTQFHRCINTLSFKKGMTALPPGASQYASMRYVDTKGVSYSCSDVYVSNNPFSVEGITVHEEFDAFYKLLSSRCYFPESETNASDRVFSEKQELDRRYFEETLWICEKCGTGNLFENHTCVKCGEARKW